jgi:hypothetical protein
MGDRVSMLARHTSGRMDSAPTPSDVPRLPPQDARGRSTPR